jgi:hypothetical protein
MFFLLFEQRCSFVCINHCKTTPKEIGSNVFLAIFIYSANSIKKSIFYSKALYSKKIYTGVGNINLQTSGR